VTSIASPAAGAPHCPPPGGAEVTGKARSDLDFKPTVTRLAEQAPALLCFSVRPPATERLRVSLALHLALSRTTMGSSHLPASSPAGWASVAASKGPSAAPATGRLHADVISCQLPLNEPERGSVSEPTAGLSEPTGRNGVFVAPVGDGPLFQDARGQQSAYSPIFGGIRAWPPGSCAH
jgi:hypothetical protein